MRILTGVFIFVILFISCSTPQKEIKKEINKQEQIYQSEKAFRELQKEK